MSEPQEPQEPTTPENTGGEKISKKYDAHTARDRN